MIMSSRERMERALAFKEADRVPVEVWLPPSVINYPKAKDLVELVNKYSDNFKGLSAFDWGFYGVSSKYSTEELDSDSEYSYTLVTHETQKGKFTGIIQRDLKNPSYWHWKKNFIDNEDDLKRFAESDFMPIGIPGGYLTKLDEHCKNEYTPIIGLHHPFGSLARISHPQDFYVWLLSDPEIIHKLFQKQYEQIIDFINRLKAPRVFSFTALEMAVPPWLNDNMFDEFIFDYDKRMNDAIHFHGGLVRHHCHDKVFKHLLHWADMGIDSIEPLEMPPAGDTDLAEAKKMLGTRMSLGGNIPSQRFITLENPEIEQMVKDAIHAAAKGGGFILKCASSVCGLNSYKNLEQLDKLINATECFINSGIRYGSYL